MRKPTIETLAVMVDELRQRVVLLEDLLAERDPDAAARLVEAERERPGANVDG